MPGSAGAALAAVLLVSLLAASGFRVVADHERLVVRRFGRLRGVRGPGLRFLLPGVDRPVRISLRTARQDVWLKAVTLDGVSIKAGVLVMLAVRDPARSAAAAESPLAACRDAVDAAVGAVLAGRDLAGLAARGPVDVELLARVGEAVEPWGLRAELVTITGIDVPLHPELLRWAHDLAPAR